MQGCGFMTVCIMNLCFIKQQKYFIQEEWLNAEKD